MSLCALAVTSLALLVIVFVPLNLVGSESTAATGPEATTSGSGQGNNPANDQIHGECPAINGNCQDVADFCSFKSREGIRYSLKDFANKQFHIGLQSPKGSYLKFHLCSHPAPQIACHNGAKSPACITVPGVRPMSTGKDLTVEQLEPNIPSMGMNLVYNDGDVCEVTKIPRRTVIKLPCSHEALYSLQTFHPKQAWEGTNKEICTYFVEFPPSKYGCPIDVSSSLADPRSDRVSVSTTLNHGGLSPPLSVPEIMAVTGCRDSDPARTTSECHFAGKIRLILHGINFHSLCSTDSSSAVSISTACVSNFNHQFSVSVGSVKCSQVVLVSQYQINCTVEGVSGVGLDVVIKRKPLSSGGDGEEEEEELVAAIRGAVSFKERINYRERFSKFVEMGVGGMKREISELYRRAFASRGTSSELLEQLGVTHVKGILLFGPPGSGKTLLARTIANILGSNQVALINGPEIISKYLGESERNLRLYFQEPHRHWKEYGPLSDLFVIIIDEIDAICKPRGKADQSAAGVAYDALVNQLLTLMDGLNEIHNTLIIGLTNRRELLDPALLRPGRFEVQIEVSLPDADGREEIFEIHTREMRRNGLLGGDVSSWELAANTSQFSGAEIAGVVRAASSYALERYQLAADPAQNFEPSVIVTSSDFSRAIKEINPAYTHSESHILTNFLPLGYLPCGESHDLAIDSALDMIHVLMTSTVTRTQSLLLYGPRGSGKTTLAAHLAMMGKFSFVRIITAASLVSMHEARKVDAMYQTFNDAYKSETAIIILDDLHRLVEYVEVGSQVQVSHGLLHSLLTLLTTTHPSSTKLMVVATMTASGHASLQEPTALGLPPLFSQHQFVPLLGPEEAKLFIAARKIKRLDGSQFVLPGSLVISVQQLVLAVDCACARSEVICALKKPTHIRQQHLLDCIMTLVT